VIWVGGVGNQPSGAHNRHDYCKLTHRHLLVKDVMARMLTGAV
jgi:hypothetical protein